MNSLRTGVFAGMALVAFAANSVLCRAALERTSMDPTSFTVLRLLSGAITLAILSSFRGSSRPGGTWGGGVALFVYAAGFSFAYVGLSTGTGALIMFGAVQVTMFTGGILAGERPGARSLAGILLALVGLVYLLLPGVTAPPMDRALLMLVAGAAWGIYSLLGRGTGDPLRATAGNFLRTLPLVLLLALFRMRALPTDGDGVAYAVLSGAVASGLGYAVWYAALPGLRATSAGVLHLVVPVLATGGGVLLLGEAIPLRLALATVIILGGITLVFLGGKQKT
jgi:drug/metabolite transporter (DMT)-like permease